MAPDNYVRMGDTRDVSLNGNMAVAGAVSGSSLSTTGNATVAGALTSGTLVTGGNATVSGSVQSSGNVTANGTVSSLGAVQAQGGLYSWNGQMYLQPSAWAGWGCASNGQVTTDPNGKLLSCQAGVWKNSASGGIVNDYGANNGSGFINIYPPAGTSVSTHKIVANITPVSSPTGCVWTNNVPHTIQLTSDAGWGIITSQCFQGDGSWATANYAWVVTATPY